jgi:hypothetical protein
MSLVLSSTVTIFKPMYYVGKSVMKYIISFFIPNILISFNDKDSTSLVTVKTIPYNTPTMSGIGVKILSILVVDVPMFVLCQMYTSPVPSLLLLYTVLPYSGTLAIVSYINTYYGYFLLI